MNISHPLPSFSFALPVYGGFCHDDFILYFLFLISGFPILLERPHHSKIILKSVQWVFLIL